MQTEQQPRQAFVAQVRQAIGPKLKDLSPRQKDLLDASLTKLYRKGRPVSDEEIQGKLELVTEFVSPAGQEKVQKAYWDLRLNNSETGASQKAKSNNYLNSKVSATDRVSSIKEKYPLFSDIEVRDLRDQGVQDGRRLEFTEAYDDRYDKPLIEIFDPALQGEELEQAIIGEFLHEAPRRIPEYAELRERLQELKTPQQLQDDMNSYLYDVENYGEDRPFEKWDEVSRKDAFIRGHAVGQWEPEYYTDEQKALIDEMMGLIRSGANK